MIKHRRGKKTTGIDVLRIGVGEAMAMANESDLKSARTRRVVIGTTARAPRERPRRRH
jgi:hypothetical protein